MYKKSNMKYDERFWNKLLNDPSSSKSSWSMAKMIGNNFTKSSLPALTKDDSTMDVFKHHTIYHILDEPNKASGADGIPHVVLKRCAPELTPVP